MCWGGVGCAHLVLFSEGGRRETHNGDWAPLVKKLFDFLFGKETTDLSKHLCVASTHHQGIAAGGRLQACGWQVCRESSERGQQRPPKHGQTMPVKSQTGVMLVGKKISDCCQKCPNQKCTEVPRDTQMCGLYFGKKS